MGILSNLVLKVFETGLIPEKIIRFWSKRQLTSALKCASLGDVEARHAVFKQVLKEFKGGTEILSLNEESLCPGRDFYELFLGKRLSEGCCYFPTGAEDLDEAEDTMLWMTADRAKIRDGMKVLEVGTGWGAMGFWLAEKYPRCQILSLVEESERLDSLRKLASDLNLRNIEFVSWDFNALEEDSFDRIICIEKLHLLTAHKNWDTKISQMLKKDGKLFLQCAVHSQFAYYQENAKLKNSIGKYIHNPVMVPSADLILMLQDPLNIEEYHKISGEAYRLTAEKRLKKYYFNRMAVFATLGEVYGKKWAWIWMQRWKMHMINTIVQYGLNRGQEWIVAQYLLAK